MSGAAGRRDTPAARAALARRRQRAAHTLDPDGGNVLEGTAVPVTATTTTRSTATSAATSQLPPPRTTTTTLTVDTKAAAPPRSLSARRPPSSSSTPSTTGLVPKRRHPTEGTHTPAPVVTPPSFDDALAKSQQAAEHAQSVLNAVHVARIKHPLSRSSSHASSSRGRNPVPAKPTASAVAAAPPTSRAAPPQPTTPPTQDVLLQSQRRRQALESKQRSATNSVTSPSRQVTRSRSAGTPTKNTIRPVASSSPPRPVPSPNQQLRQSTASIRKLRQLRSRSPSPNRRSGGMATNQTGPLPLPQALSNRPTPLHQRQRQQQQSTPPRPTQQQQQPQSSRSPADRPTPLQIRAMQQLRKSASPLQHQTDRPKQPRTPSLNDVLMDSSYQDASTLADITLHQMHGNGNSTPRNANTTNTYISPGRPLFSDSLYSSTKQHPRMAEEANWQYRDTDSRVREAKEQDQSPPNTAAAAWDPVYSSLVDAAVLRSGADICLRSYSYPATVGVDVNATQETYQLASLVGVGLGRPQEILTLQKVVSTDSQDDNVVVRHGDTIMLHSAIAGNLALGSRKFVHSASGSSKVQLGFFGHGGKAELWTIFPARPDQEILVGPAALAYPQKDPMDKPKKSIPLRSSDPIILRNVYNGGILSIDSNGLLVLLTDSYQHDQQYTEDPSLLGRLQQHNRMMPTPEDTFQMILTQTPPCPPWIAQGGSEERIFLTGSYCWQEGRNEPNIHLNSGCFPRDVTYSTVLQAAQRYVASDENLSPKTKERILMDEVIGSFLGLEGVHIRMQATKGANDANKEWFEFRLVSGDEVTFDAGLRNLVDQILPLSTSFVRVRNFVASHQPGYEYGRVMQAFCEAIDALLQDYVNFVSHLEWELRRYAKADTLTIKSIYFQAAPSIHSMSILEHATEAVAECKGGELINKLWALDKRSYMGDTVAKKVLGILLEKASEPYMEIMSDWLQTGRLNDPSGEFMVQRCAPNTRTVLDGDSWFTLFQINEEHVLQGIAPNNWTKDKILTTGKYWNAVQDCHLDSKDIQRPTKHSKIPSLPFNSDSSAIAAYIDAKYQSASKVLVRILIENFKIMESLQIMKRYFLVDQGDFLMHFMDAAEQELLKPRDEISMGRLQHWLNMSVQFTEAHKEDWGPVSGLRIPSCPLIPAGLRCRLSDESLVSHLDSRYGGGIADRTPVTPSRRAYGMSTHVTGIEVFTIDFPHIPFPISLLMSQKAMDEYRLLFRHLFFTKHVERRLIGVWKDNQLLKKLGTLRGPLGSTFLLRQKMLHLVQNLIYYMVYEVVESNWTDMRNALDDRSDGNTEKPQTVDDMLNIHNSFLERTLEACLLTNSDLIRSLTKLMNTCLLFTDQMRRFMDTTKIYDDSLNLAAEKRGVVQRNLNERGSTAPGQANKRALRQALSATREERQMILSRQTRRVGREVNSDSYQRMIRRFNEVFSQDLANFMTQLHAHASSGVASNLGIRLDYNGYVTGSGASR